MKRTKRQENWIIIHFVFYFIAVIGLLIVIFSNIIPQIKEIENDKKLTKDLYENITRVKNEWLSYKEFIGLNNWWNKNRVISEIIKWMENDFYSKHLVNTSNSKYSDFLNAKEEELKNDENSQKIEEKTEQLSKILPYYTDTWVDLWNNSLTDYKFINYIESLLQTFNLSTDNPIGINKINILEDFIWTENKKDQLDSNLFYIPLNMTLKWNKQWIIEFLYFIENVWKITVQEWEVSIDKVEWILSRNWRKTVLEWDKFNAKYNVFEHQIIDIEKISMAEYLDSSYLSRGEKDFKEFIIIDQWTENYEITVNLQFYVKWQPIYKIEEYILEILNKHSESTKIVNSILKNPESDEIKKATANKYNKTLITLSQTVAKLRKEMTNKDKLEDTYQKAQSLNNKLDPIFIELSK